MKKILGFSGVLGAAFLLSSLVAPRTAQAIGPKLLNFQIGAFYAAPVVDTGPVSALTDNHLSGQIAWTPGFSLGFIGVRGELGLSLLKNPIGDSFTAINYEAYVQLSLLPILGLELGGGIMDWKSNGGSSGIYGVNLVLSLIGPLDRVYVGYSRFTLGSGFNIFKAGLGINL